MENISCAAELKLAISEKQFELNVQGQLLKEEFFIVYESLKPISLIKNTLAEITSSPYLIENMLGGVMGLVSGYVSKKIAVGTSHNLFRKIMGSLVQFGVTNLVAQHSDVLKNYGQLIIAKIFHKNEQK
ncbi:MAG: hypothetical protein WCK78_17000 [Paludibacter sp.]